MSLALASQEIYFSKKPKFEKYISTCLDVLSNLRNTLLLVIAFAHFSETCCGLATADLPLRDGKSEGTKACGGHEAMRRPGRLLERMA